MRVRGKRAIIETFEVDPIEVMEDLKSVFGLIGEGVHLHEGKLYEWEDVGTHRSDYQRKLFSEDSKDIRIFRAITLIINELKNPTQNNE